MHACIVADGGAPTRVALDEAWPGWADDVDLVIAADGGARSAPSLGLKVDLVVGDLDSLDAMDVERLSTDGVPIERASPAKDETDTELALIAARDRGATRITILGAVGGDRLDHALANVLLLAHPAIAGCRVELLDPGGRVSLLRAPGPDGGPVFRDLAGPVGALVSLIPLGVDAEHVATEGLAYPLRGETLAVGPARGCSNVRTAGTARVTLGSGLLLVIESPARLAP
jgi:thiamine pyrophosphokinase